MYNQINQLTIIEILDKLGIKYRDLGNGTIGLIEDGKLSNGRRGNIIDNYLHDFSGKGRANGPAFSIVKKYLNLTDHEVFQWFKIHFNIENNKKVYRNRGSPTKQKKNKVIRPYSRAWMHF